MQILKQNSVKNIELAITLRLAVETKRGDDIGNPVDSLGHKMLTVSNVIVLVKVLCIMWLYASAHLAGTSTNLW